MFKHICNYNFGLTERFALYNSVRDNKDILQRFKLLKDLDVHNGCVNTICWNDSGEYILSGSDDIHLCITSAYTFKMVSCSGDGVIIFTDLDSPFGAGNNSFNCHFGTTYELRVFPDDPFSFMSCGEDGTVRYFDLRTKFGCLKDNCKEDVLINCRRAVTSICINPMATYQVAVGCSDSTVRIYDRRMLGTPASGYSIKESTRGLVSLSTIPMAENRKHRITSLCYDSIGKELLVSYSAENVYLYNIKDEKYMVYESAKSLDDKARDAASSAPPMKRLRVRGDWSDTGPNARPESESGTSVPESPRRNPFRSTLIQRMSDVLTRMFNDPSRSRSSARRSSSLPEPSSNETSQQPSSSGPQQSSPSDGNEEIAETSGAAASPDNTDTKPVIPSSSKDVEVKPCDSLESQTVKSSGEKTESISEEAVAGPSSSDVNIDNSGKDLMKKGFQSIETDLRSLRKEFIDKNKMEPVVNLTYDAKGASSGVISVDVPDMLERTHITSAAEADSQSHDQSDESNPVPDATGSEHEATPSKSSTNHATDGVDSTQAENSNLDVHSERDDVSNSSHVSSVRDVLVDSESDNDAEVSSDEEINDDVITAMHDRIVHSTREMTPQSLSSDDEGIDNPKEREERELRRMNLLPHYKPYRSYSGHRNARTMIKEVNFWGDRFIVSGSDCGHVFFWDKETTDVVMLLEADRHVVNCVQPHPYDPILASSGIDYDVKLWAPIGEDDLFDSNRASEIARRNKVMLGESMDTITVPASFMIRMLASFNHIRSAGGLAAARNRAQRERESQEESGGS